MQPDNQYPRQLGDKDTDEMNALVGKSLGQLRIVERIGAGGMATVFKAYQPNLDRYVAVKVLPSYHARDPIFVKRFTQEARSVAKLAHPNIVQIHDFGTQDDITYIVMEYVDGGTLKDRLKRPLAVPEAVEFMIQAAEGLDCAHRNGIIHRDVKPANMLLRKDGYLLLSDFGIAKILEGTTNLTRVGTGIGTPQYMSPEQGTGQAVDRRSDIYSLGIVLFHCLTGRVPFTADNPLTITVKHLNEPLPVEQLRLANVPMPIEQVVSTMTAKQAPDRYQSTDALIDALTTALAASNLIMPHRWRPGMSSSMPKLESQPGVSLPLSTPGLLNVPSQPLSSNVNNVAGGQQVVTVQCFRCGSANPSTRLFCTACGYELADKRAVNDRYMGPNGRPILARLSIQNGPMGGRSYLFHQDVTTIGRNNGNDLVIPGRTVSRRHARLWFADGYWYLEDLQSGNGTSVNNVRIYQAVVLNNGDVISFGDEIVVFNTTY
ncbi:MAG TPA: FHA domain-containing serine/threonine-protein kinase [Ktedonobacteraceae bacterium]|nr:FHA domain-containing serine/threonine-protein kinase [Ktedonobacteraceae bacterium]